MALPADDHQALARLQDVYPLWMIRESGIGRWWANRQETFLRPGCSVTVHADTLDNLAELLEEQERLRRQRQPAGFPAVLPAQESRWHEIQDPR